MLQHTNKHLKQIIEKIERLEEDKVNIIEDIKEVYNEAKNHGFDIQIIKQVVKIRKMDSEDKAKLQEQEALLQTYLDALKEI